MRFWPKLLISLILVFFFSAGASVRPMEKQTLKPPENKSFFYYDAPQGWFWYREKLEQNQEETEKKPPILGKAGDLKNLPSDYLTKVAGKLSVKQLRQLAKVLLDQAMEPEASSEEVRKYMVIHREVLNRSDSFARRWQDVLMADAYFDFPGYFIPVVSPAQEVWAELKKEKQKKKLKEIAKVGKLTFFFDHDPYSKKQAEALFRISEEYGLEIVPITRKEAEAKGWQVGQYPSVFLYLAYPEGLIRLGSGYLVYSELIRRMIRGFQVLTQKAKDVEDR